VAACLVKRSPFDESNQVQCDSICHRFGMELGVLGRRSALSQVQDEGLGILGNQSS
jgi:hypothetical protein